MLLILCVDGLDPDLVEEFGCSMAYETRLSIPRELYYTADPSYKPHPHTWLVWPSMFSGKIIQEIPFRISYWRRMVRKLLVALSKRRKGSYKVAPINREIDMIFNHYPSYIWNIPTISPEWIVSTPGLKETIDLTHQEYQTFKLLAPRVARLPNSLGAVYTRILDIYGHLEKPLENFYFEIFRLAHKMATFSTVVLVSDHGTPGGPYHTDNAYLGSNVPVFASSVLKVRENLEEILKDSMWQAQIPLQNTRVSQS